MPPSSTRDDDNALEAGSKDLMSSSEKEAIKQNQACQEEALRRIIDLRVADAIASKPKEIVPLLRPRSVTVDTNGRGRHGHSWSPCLFRVLVELMVVYCCLDVSGNTRSQNSDGWG